MNDELYLPGAALPMFGRVLLSPDQPAAGDPAIAPAPEADPFNVEGMAESMNQGVEPEAPVEGEPQAEPVAEAGAPAPEAAAAPTPSELEKLKADFEAYKQNTIAESNAVAERAFNDFIRRKAATSAAAYEHLMGVKPPPGMFPAAAKPVDPNATLEQKLQHRLDEQEARLKAIDQREKDREEQARVETERQGIAATLVEAQVKHKAVYEDPLIGEVAQQALLSAFLKQYAETKRKPDVVALASQVAKRFTDYTEGVKKSFVNGKQQAAAKIAPGAGPAGGRQPGPVKTEIDLSTRKGRADAARRMAESVQE